MQELEEALANSLGLITELAHKGHNRLMTLRVRLDRRCAVHCYQQGGQRLVHALTVQFRVESDVFDNQIPDLYRQHQRIVISVSIPERLDSEHYSVAQ